MSFFFNDTKAEKPAKKAGSISRSKRADIPIQSLQQLGCSACPRDKDESLRSPKMKPSGSSSPLIYLLGTAPTTEDDDEDLHWCDKAGETIFSKFGKHFMEESVRSNYTMQCRGEADTRAIECCRSRIVRDIEESKPLVIVGVGDEPLRWATQLPSKSSTTIPHRGTLFTVKIGKHVCYFYPVMYPNFVHKKGWGKSEHETILEHDIRWIKKWVESDDYQAPEWLHPEKGHNLLNFDEGIEIITGHEPGDMQRLEKALVEIAKLRDNAIDLETTGLRVFMQKKPGILTCAVGIFERVVAFPVHHPEGWGTSAQMKRVEVLLLKFIMNSGTKHAHNLAFEMEWLSYFFGNEILRRTDWGDTQAMAHSLDERAGTKSLEVQTVIHFGFNLKEQSNIDTSRLLEYPLKKVLRYNGMDAKWTDALRRRLKPKVEEVPAYLAEYDRKVRTASSLVILENLGLPMDREYALDMEVKFGEEAAKIEEKIRRSPEVKEYTRRFGTFSHTNNDHILKLMRDICERDECAVIDKKTGKRTGWTTNEDVLATIPARDVPSAPLFVESRGLEKMLSTYLKPVTSGEIVGVDGMLHAKYGTMVAETGRFNSEDPNAQNWPKRKYKEIRGIIAAERRKRRRQKMVACDYGQIEFRVVGMASEDRNLVKACWTGYDVHKFWAERMMKLHGPIIDWILDEFVDDFAKARNKDGNGFDEDKMILKLLRQESKNRWVFPQLFGSAVRTCAENLHLPLDIAEDLAAEFWDEFREVKEWQEWLLDQYLKKGYVETLDGRRRRGAMSPNQIINHPIQGTAASIVCAGMNALSERAEIEERWDCHPRFNGHDDLSFFMDEDRIKPNLEIITYEMCKPRHSFVNVPLLVEASVGDRWNELEEVGKYWSNKIFNTPNPYAEAR